MRVFIVDDEPTNVFLVKKMLARQGFHFQISTSDPHEVAPMATKFRPDLILLDIAMPQMDGIGVLRELSTLINDEGYLPIIAMTSTDDRDSRELAFATGAKDFVRKPLDPSEVLQRSRSLLEARFLHCQLREANLDLEARVLERTAQLEAAQIELVDRLSAATNMRDDQTGDHVIRVGDLCESIAINLGVEPVYAYLIGLASRLHDIGKIGIPDSILLKPGKLDAEEYRLMQEHTSIGGCILENAGSGILKIAHRIAMSHHERWDGKGYPYGLMGEEIPIEGRICAVADVYDSLTNERPYKGAWEPIAALNEIERCSGTHFDPQVVDAFFQIDWVHQLREADVLQPRAA